LDRVSWILHFFRAYALHDHCILMSLPAEQ
jgi:hypothetical protein